MLSLRIRAALAALHVRRADALAENGAKLQELGAADALLTESRLDALACCADWHMTAALLHQHAQVQARKGAFSEATETVARSVSRYTWLGDSAAQASALIDFGRFAMAAGDSISAQDALHEAFDLGTQFEMPSVQSSAAGVLVRVHQIRARHARRADAEFAAFTVLKAQESRTLLGYHGFDNHAAALDQVITSLG